MGSTSWVTLATNDSYSLGALVLAHSLRKVKTVHQLSVLITPAVSPAMREQLATVFDLVKLVDVLDSKDEANLALLKRPELGITFTKLHCWKLTEFEKGVFLDADTLVVRNCDELFEREEFSAAPDVGWPDCFNSGVFVFRPSIETFTSLIQFAVEKGSFDGGDQGLLNQFFSSWATDDIRKHLPFIYNLTSVAVYSYIPAFKQYGGETRIVHFIGPLKPWLQPVDPASRSVTPAPDSAHIQPLLQQWWDLFIEKVHPGLSSSLGCTIGMLPFFTQPACSQDPLDSTLASSDAPPPAPEPSFPEPYTPYIQKDDARQYNLPYQPFQVVSSEGELLNITFADFARESDLKEEESPESSPDNEVYTSYDEKESDREPDPEPETSPEPEQDQPPPATVPEQVEEHEEEEQMPMNEPEPPSVEENPFGYHRFVPDESCISAYLEHNVQHYQPFDENQQHLNWSQPQPEEQALCEAPTLPRFLTIPEDDPRQGHYIPPREPSPENHYQPSWQQENHQEHWEGHYDYHQLQPQSESETNQVPAGSDRQNEPAIHRAPSPGPPPDSFSAPQPDPPSISRSKSMSHLVIDATDTSTFQNIISWKSQPEVNQVENPVETPKKLPGLKPLVPKVKSPTKPDVMPKYTEFTEVNMVSEVSDPFAPPVDKLGFVERAIMKRVESRKGMFDVPQGALEVAPPPVIRRPSLLQEMNEYVDLAECKRQAGNPLLEPEGKTTEESTDVLKTFSPRLPHRREKRSTRRAAEKWKPPETSNTTYDVDAILKRLSTFSTGVTPSLPPKVAPSALTNGSTVHSEETADFSKYRDYVAERVEVVEKGLAAFDDIISSTEPVWRTETPADRLFRDSSSGLENLSTKVADRGVLLSSGEPDYVVHLSKKAQRKKTSKKSEKSSSRKKGSKTGKFGPISESETFPAPHVPSVAEMSPLNVSNPFAAPPGESLSEMEGSVPEIVVCVASPEEELSVIENLKVALGNFEQTYIVSNIFDGEMRKDGDLANEKVTLEMQTSEVLRIGNTSQSYVEVEFVTSEKGEGPAGLARNGERSDVTVAAEILSPVEKIVEVFGTPLEVKEFAVTPAKNGTENGAETNEPSGSPESFESALSHLSVGDTPETTLTEVYDDGTAPLPQTNGASFDDETVHLPQINGATFCDVLNKIGMLSLTSTPKTNVTQSVAESESDELAPAITESFSNGLMSSVRATENKSEGVEPEAELRMSDKGVNSKCSELPAVQNIELKEQEPDVCRRVSEFNLASAVDSESRDIELEKEVEIGVKEGTYGRFVASSILNEPTATGMATEPISEFLQARFPSGNSVSEVLKNQKDSLVESEPRQTENVEGAEEPLSENVEPRTAVDVPELSEVRTAAAFECEGLGVTKSAAVSGAEPVDVIPDVVETFTAVDVLSQQVVTEEAVTDIKLAPAADEEPHLPTNEKEVLASAETLPEEVQNIEISEDTLKFDLSKLVSDDDLALSNLETSTPSEKGEPSFERTIPSSSLKWSEKPVMSYAAAARKESSGAPASSSLQPTTFLFMPALAPQPNELNKRPRKSQGTKKKPKQQQPPNSSASPPHSETPVLSPVKHVKRKIEKLEVEVERPANRFELLPADTPELLTQCKKKVKKTVPRFAAPSSSTSPPSFPSSSQPESIVRDTEEEPQLYLPEPNDSPGIAGAIAQLSLEPSKEGVSSGASAAQAEYLRRQSWETGKMDYMGRDSFANVWSKISETLSQQPIAEGVRASPPRSSPSPAPAESRPVSLAMILDSDSIDTLPSDVATSPGEAADDDVIFDRPLEANTGLPGILEETEEPEEEPQLPAPVCDVSAHLPPSVADEASQLSFESNTLAENMVLTSETVVHESVSVDALPPGVSSPEMSSDVITGELISPGSAQVDPPSDPSKVVEESEAELSSTAPSIVPESSAPSVTPSAPESLLSSESAETSQKSSTDVSPAEVTPPSPTIGSDSSSAFVAYKPVSPPVKEVDTSTSKVSTEPTSIRRQSTLEEGKEKKGVLTKLLEFVGVVKKKEDSESSSSVFYDDPPVEDKAEGKLTEGVAGIQDILKATDLSAISDEVVEESKKRSPSPRVLIPAIPHTHVIAATPPTTPGQKPARRDPEALTVDTTIPETPPVVEKKTPILVELDKENKNIEISPSSPLLDENADDVEISQSDIQGDVITQEMETDQCIVKTETEIKIDRDSVMSEIDGIIAKAKLIAEDQSKSAEPIYSNVVKKSAKVVIVEPPAPPIALCEEFEEIHVTSEEERKRTKEKSTTSKLAGQILKAIPPPRRRAISDARTPSGPPGPSIAVCVEKPFDVVLGRTESSPPTPSPPLAALSSSSGSAAQSPSPPASLPPTPIPPAGPPLQTPPTPPPVPPRRHRSKQRAEPQPPPKRKTKK